MVSFRFRVLLGSEIDLFSLSYYRNAKSEENRKLVNIVLRNFKMTSPMIGFILFWFQWWRKFSTSTQTVIRVAGSKLQRSQKWWITYEVIGNLQVSENLYLSINWKIIKFIDYHNMTEDELHDQIGSEDMDGISWLNYSKWMINDNFIKFSTSQARGRLDWTSLIGLQYTFLWNKLGEIQTALFINTRYHWKTWVCV